MKSDHERFDQAMFRIYETAKSEAGYTASVFLGMLGRQGGVLTAKQLINGTKPSDGYTALFERGRLDLTVEALVVENEKWHSLFSAAELALAKKRLRDYGYQVPAKNI
ncbi:hypothetical protein [Mesorhizobium sp.]|uniref:hypothetical protein n=1 Tax=Mesorhizobium sp. TaxID=1871066 RepID=UPI00257962AC|nr:hypothetical protein [Mesorhizobium sp.]